MIILRLSFQLSAFLIIWLPLIRVIFNLNSRKRAQLLSLLITSLFICLAAFLSLDALMSTDNLAKSSVYLFLVTEAVPALFTIYIIFRVPVILRIPSAKPGELLQNVSIVAVLIAFSFIVKIYFWLPVIAPYRWDLNSYPVSASGMPILNILIPLFPIALNNLTTGNEKSFSGAFNRSALFCSEQVAWFGLFIWELHAVFSPLKVSVLSLICLLLILLMVRAIRLVYSYKNDRSTPGRLTILSHSFFLLLIVIIFNLSIKFSG